MPFKDLVINLVSKFSGPLNAQNYPLDYCIPLYHTVSDQPLPHLKHLYRVKSEKEFEKDLDYLLKHFIFAEDWQSFTKLKKSGVPVGKKVALLTFDDGLSEFLHVAAPILERKGIYAVNFVNPAFVDQQDMLFRCKASLLVEKIQTEQADLKLLQSISGLQNAGVQEISHYILKTAYKRRALLDLIAESIGLNFTEYIRANKPYLDVTQLQELKSKGFGIGAHSWDHPYYSELTVDEQLETTFRSLDFMKTNGFLQDAFAFPFTDYGVSKSFFEQLYQRYPHVYSFGTAGIKTDSFIQNLQRIPMEHDAAATILRRETAYFRLKAPLKKNLIIRK